MTLPTNSQQIGKKDIHSQYGKVFAEFIGSMRGGMAEIVGKVVQGSCSARNVCRSTLTTLDPT